MGQERYRQALIAVIAAAYRVVDTWEMGDLSGCVSVLGAIAGDWDEALGLGVARRQRMGEQDRGERDAGDLHHLHGEKTTQEGDHDRRRGA